MVGLVRYDWLYVRYVYNDDVFQMRVTKSTKVAATTPVKAVKKVASKQKNEDDLGPDLKHFTCSSCKGKFFDIELYFKGTKAKKCISCVKFPKDKK